MTTILITGANGFIARHLAHHLRPQSYRLIGTSRRSESCAGFGRVYRASLGDSLAPVFEGEKVGCIVHCANATGEDELRKNIDGTSLWMEEARLHGVGLQIFLSSLSASPGALSDYGRAKHALEERFTAIGQVVFKFGLVIGDGGMFTRIAGPVRNARVVPLLDEGKAPTYILGIDTLCKVIGDCIRQNGSGLRGRVWYIQQPRAYPLREVMSSIKRQYGCHSWLIPVPALPVLWLVQILERLPFLKLPVTSTNIKGLIQSRKTEFPSDFGQFGYPEEDLDQLVGRAAGLIPSDRVESG
jgi:nucleoside-diphosphate-sugar epimerase